MSPRFTLLRRLGQGAMGVVWQARDEESGQIVALKLLREAYADDPEYRSRFERELELARRVHSPHVVQVLGYGVREGSPYLALEYVDGPSLRERLAEHGPYAWPEARALLAQLAAGLADAHAAGILHRDVKPSNVLLASDGTAKLTDFGIARGLDLTRVTGTSTLLGTPAYLAPEGPLDARSDLYALGVIAYELLAGAPPFEGPTYQAVILAHIRTPPDLSKLPPEARSIVGWLLAKDPAQRPQSAAELLAALQDQGSVPAIAPPRPAPAPVATTPPSRPPRRRPRALAGLAALALVVLLVGAALAMGGRLAGASGPSHTSHAPRTLTAQPGARAPTSPSLAPAASLVALLPSVAALLPTAAPTPAPTPLVAVRPTVNPAATVGPTPLRTPRVIAPAAPTGITAVALNRTQVRVSWGATGPGVVGLELYSRDMNTRVVTFVQLASTARSYVETLSPNGRRAYKLRARNSAGYSSWSAYATVQTPDQPPYPVTVLSPAEGSSVGFPVDFCFRSNGDPEGDAIRNYWLFVFPPQGGSQTLGTYAISQDGCTQEPDQALADYLASQNLQSATFIWCVGAIDQWGAGGYPQGGAHYVTIHR